MKEKETTTGAKSRENSARTADAPRVVGKPFEKGRSGNPHGRPRTPDDVKAMFRAATKPAAQYLITTLQDDTKPDKIRLQCAQTLLDRALGKAVQPIDGATDSTITISVPDDVRALLG